MCKPTSRGSSVIKGKAIKEYCGGSKSSTCQVCAPSAFSLSPFLSSLVSLSVMETERKPIILAAAELAQLHSTLKPAMQQVCCPRFTITRLFAYTFACVCLQRVTGNARANVVFHGFLEKSQWNTLLATSKFMLGVGDPLLGERAGVCGCPRHLLIPLTRCRPICAGGCCSGPHVH